MVNAEKPSPLRVHRLLRGLRLRDLEQLTGIPDTTLSRLERGELSLTGRWLTILANNYAIPASTLTREMEQFLGIESSAPGDPAAAQAGGGFRKKERR
jgi:transcriptional regulator with XRE-family HTH domain